MLFAYPEEGSYAYLLIIPPEQVGKKLVGLRFFVSKVLLAANMEENFEQKRALEQAAKNELRTEDQGTVPGRRYTERIIRTCVKLYLRVKCGFRGVSEILDIFNEEFGVGKGVSHTSVSDWVKTTGLALYKEACDGIRTARMKYALVIDESITIGSQKLLLVFAIPSEHKRHALTHKDVKVVGNVRLQELEVRRRVKEASIHHG